MNQQIKLKLNKTKKSFIIFIVLVSFFGATYSANAYVLNLGRTYFGDNAATTGTLRYKSMTVSPATWTAQVNSAAANSANSMITWIVAKTAPTRDEQMVGMLRINGTLDIQTCTTNSAVCTARWNNPGTQAGTPLCTTTATAGTCVQPFDIGYEQLSGRGMVVYGDTTAGKVYYALWNGSSWSPNATPGTPGASNEMVLSGGTKIPRWVRVVPSGDNLADDRSNRIIILVGSSVNVNDAAYTLDAFYWDGTTMSSVTNLSTTLGNCTKGRCFDGNWQGNVNFVVSYTNNGVAETRYNKYVVGTGWAGDAQAYTNAATPIFVESRADPKSSRVIVTTVTSGNDVRTAVWRADGATDGWTVCASGGCPDTAIETVGGQDGSASFTATSSQAIISFNDAGTTGDSSYWKYTTPSTWTATAVTGITTTDDALNTKTWTMPNNNDIMMFVEDVDCRLRGRLWTNNAWNGTTVEMNNGTTATLSNYGVTCPGSTSPGVAPIGIPYAYDFAPKIYSPWTMNWRWYDGTSTANSPTPALANENATTTSFDGYSGKTRLRFNVSELSAGVNQTDARKKLQYSTTSPEIITSPETYWADVDNSGGSAEWRYYDCDGGTAVCNDGTVVSANVLTGSTAAGWWNTSKDAAPSTNMDHASSSVRELEFPIEANNTATGTTYYFRMYDVEQLTPVFRRQDAGATPCAGSSTCKYPAIVTATSTYNLEAYRFYENNDGTQVGNLALAAQNATTTLTSAGQEFRLRLLMHVGVAGLGVNKADLKLQYAEKGAGTWCGAPAGSWTDVTTGTAISFLDNATPTDGSAMTASTTDPTGHTVVAQTYEEANDFTNPSAIPSGQDGKWDLSLHDNGATPNGTYCLRVVSNEPGSITTYTTYPAVIMAAPASAPTVTTSAASSITQTTATLNGNITATGGANATQHGFAWGTSSTLATAATTTGGGFTGTGAFTSSSARNISGLSCNTVYYYRAYATNSGGTGFSSIANFTTSPCNPTVTTSAASSITQTAATLNGDITVTGGANATERGFAFGSNSNVNTSTTTYNGSFGVEPFSAGTWIQLSCNTTYYFRAYATNPGGTGYGTVESFTTSPCNPTVSTSAASAITQTTATLNGNVDATGGGNATEHGFAWGTSSTLATAATTTGGGFTGTGAFTSSSARNISGLSCNTVYYYRAYATNSGGTGFSSIANFTSGPCNPGVSTAGSVDNLTQTSATLNGLLSTTGGENPSEHGFAWGSDSTLATAATTTGGALAGVGNFTSASARNISGLSCNTTYYMRAYATNSGGTGMGSIQSFVSAPCNPTVSTSAASAITQTTATLNGNVDATGGGNATEHGFAWGTSSTLATAATTTGGAFTGTGAFTSASARNISGLSCNTVYYYRAYATNSGGTGYSSIANFTSGPCAPTVSTNYLSKSQTTIDTGGIISSTGGASVTVRGVVYGTVSNLSGGDTATTTENGTFGTGSYNTQLTGLTCNTLYYFKAYATNSAGTSYGSILSDTTSPCKPTVTTSAASAITQTTATLNGNVTVQGGADATQHGFAWGTDSTLATAATTTGGAFTGTGAFTSASARNISGLSCNTIYYYRAYATNSSGTGYSSIANFTSSPCKPTVTTSAAASITQTTATLNGNITVSGGADATEHGFAWGTDSTLATAATTTGGGFTGTGAFTNAGARNISGLSCNTIYYYRAYATNSGGTGHSSIANFTTSPCKPTVTTSVTVDSITKTTATLNGNVTVTGGADATEHGFAYGVDPTLATVMATTTGGAFTGTGAFTSSSARNISGLSCFILYYYRAYATNSGGTGFGAIESFTTSACAPNVTTEAASSITANTATLNGTITLTGGANATVRGFAYGTASDLSTVIATTTENGSFPAVSYTGNISSLTCNTTYYARAYATNSGGTGLGSIQSFSTSACPPTVTTQSASSVLETSATLNGSITATGGSNATVRGFAWGTNSSLSGGDTATTTDNGSWGVAAFSANLATLTCGTTYYSRAYATNPTGTGYGAISGSFTTDACSTPPDISQLHYRWRSDNGNESTADFISPEDTSLVNNIFPGDRLRLRILLSNAGGPASNYLYRLEHASSSCTTWMSVPSYATQTTEKWIIDTSTYVSNGQPTTNISGLTDPGGKSFVPGKIQTQNNQTQAMTLGTNQFTELEYSIKSTSSIDTDVNNCFRLTNNGSNTYFTYTVQPIVVVSSIFRKNTGGGGGGGGSAGNSSAGGESQGSAPAQTGGTATSTPTIEGSGSGTPQGGGNQGGGGGAGGDSGYNTNNAKFFATAYSETNMTNIFGLFKSVFGLLFR